MIGMGMPRKNSRIERMIELLNLGNGLSKIFENLLEVGAVKP